MEDTLQCFLNLKIHLQRLWSFFNYKWSDLRQISIRVSGFVSLARLSQNFLHDKSRGNIYFENACNQNILCIYGQRGIQHLHCVKSVRILSYSGPYSVRMQENVDQNNCEYGHFSHSATVEYSDLLRRSCLWCSTKKLSWNLS